MFETGYADGYMVLFAVFAEGGLSICLFVFIYLLHHTALWIASSKNTILSLCRWSHC